MVESTEIPERAEPLVGAVEPVEYPAVTGRPADEAPANSTFAERAKAASKAVKSDDAEDKAVTRATKKRR